MRCPHCNKEIEGFACSECGTITPGDANYCMKCGSSLDKTVSDAIEGPVFIEDGDEFDPETRVLCPDGTCTGILVDGRCTECGKIFRDKSIN